MKKTTKKAASSSRTVTEFRPYRVLFLVVVVSVTCLVLFAALGASAEG